VIGLRAGELYQSVTTASQYCSRDLEGRLMDRVFNAIDSVGEEITQNLLNHRGADVVLVSAALVATVVAFAFLVIETITAVAA
jgi:hypothetical protein